MGVSAYGRVGVSAYGGAKRRLEGSRFGSCPRDPAIFVMARGRPEIVLNKRHPRTFQRVLG